jgi:hypothetical protein
MERSEDKVFEFIEWERLVDSLDTELLVKGREVLRDKIDGSAELWFYLGVTIVGVQEYDRELGVDEARVPMTARLVRHMMFSMNRQTYRAMSLQPTSAGTSCSSSDWIALEILSTLAAF